MNSFFIFVLVVFDEVCMLYVLIEDWFNVCLLVDVLDILLVCFIDDFSMVGIGGVCLDKLVFVCFFVVMYGGCFGLCIVVDDVVFLVVVGNVCGVCYWEDQVDVQGCMWCEVLVLLCVDVDGVLCWQVLYEMLVGG